MTLSHDRLGIAESQHGDPLNEIQTNLEVEALRALTAQLRDGSFPGVNSSYDTIVHVGHSYGSIQSYNLAAYYPNETQGLVLTGFSTNSSFNHLFQAGGNFHLASLLSPLRFGSPGLAATVESFIFDQTPLHSYLQPLDLSTLPAPQDLPDGYIISSNANANQYNFFAPPFFDPALLAYAEVSKQPVTVGELLTLASSPATNPFTGPVLVFTGDADLPFCGGDCLATGGALASIPESVKESFTDIEDGNFEAYIQPNTGHGVTAHYNATAGYQYIAGWLSDHGLGGGN